jgi:succinate dehydrogenase / fumarate reductase iron-sulfur subunit
MKVKCDVFRFDPDSDVKARYDTYTLDAEPTETVLDALIQIQRDFDSTLSFRFACGVVKCGECSISVNNSPCLACQKVIEPEMKIDPLPGLPLIKDLVIDRRKVFETIFRLSPRLAAIGRAKGRLRFVDPDAANRYVQLTNCFECLICQSSCPVFSEMTDKFVGPLGLLWLAQTSSNPGNDAISRRDVESYLEMCPSCGICLEACPCVEDILKLAIDTLEKR